MSRESVSNSNDFDPYHKWLGIPKDKRPPTLYQLLGISPTETDVEVIASAAKRQQAFVTEFQGGPNHDAAASILFELEKARSTLLDGAKRRKYDQKLRETRERTKRTAEGTDVSFGSGSQSVGENNSIVKPFAGIVLVLCVAFAGMAVFSFKVLPWSKQPEQVEATPAAPAAAPAPAKVPVAPPVQVATIKPLEQPVKQEAVQEKPKDNSDAEPIRAILPKSQSPSDRHQVLKGHTGEVHRIAISATGKYIASGGGDHTVRLWERETAKELWNRPLDQPNVIALAFDADEKNVWVAHDTGVRRIEVMSGSTTDILEFTKCSEAYFGVNCEFVATGGAGGDARIFNTTQRKKIPPLKIGGSNVVFNKDATLLLLGGWENGPDITVLRVRDKKDIGKFKGLRDRTDALEVSPDDKFVAATSFFASSGQPTQNKVIVWEAATGRKIIDRVMPEGWYSALAFSPDSTLIAAGGSSTLADFGLVSSPEKNKIRIWKIENGTEIQTLSGHSFAVTSLAFTPDGNFIVSGSKDSTVRIWPIK